MSKMLPAAYLGYPLPNARLFTQLNAVYGLALGNTQNHTYSRDKSEDHVTGHVNFSMGHDDANNGLS